MLSHILSRIGAHNDAIGPIYMCTLKSDSVCYTIISCQFSFGCNSTYVERSLEIIYEFGREEMMSIEYILLSYHPNCEEIVLSIFV